MEEFDKKYNAQEKEAEIRDFWDKNEVFKFDFETEKPVFSIDTPPPTISGRMHIGHAYSYTQTDFIARYKRMNGFEVYYPFGTDDNGLPTEKLVQKEKKVDLRRMPRHEAINITLEYLEEARKDFILDFKNIGLSCDFENLRYSTIDDYSRQISQKSFLDLYNKNLVYRKEAPVIWDTMFQTTISQAELEDIERESFFNDIVFKVEDGSDLIIGTTRPELLGACGAVFVHPEDKRYQHLHGKKAITPIYNVEVLILPDEGAQMDKGTGAVMCCTFGDQKDIEWFKKHNLPLRMVIDKSGKMNSKAGKYEGLKVEDARKHIIEDLKEVGLLVEQKKITQVVNVGERSGKPIEIINSKQWYASYLDKKEEFLQASEKLHWVPSHMKSRLDQWIKGLAWDWNFSRQRSFGVPIPVWYCKDCGEVKLADETQLPVDPSVDKPLGECHNCGSTQFEGETDVLDTWFTSASSPFLAINKMQGKDVYKKLFPMSLRPQAHDIINFWLFYTMAKTNMLHEVNPWRDAVISGWVLDPQGKKMSKSKGNTIAPQEIVSKFSNDAIRFSAAASKLGQDMPFQEKEVKTGLGIANKIFNANKFASMLLNGFTKEDRDFDVNELRSIDKWILARLQQTIESSTKAMELYDYAKCRYEWDNFFMRDIADNYIEIVKQRLWQPENFGEVETKKAQKALYTSLFASLRGLSIFMPFVTEEVYQKLYREFENEISIHKTSWPQVNKNFVNDDLVNIGEGYLAVVGAVRKYKSEHNLSQKAQIKVLSIECNEDLQNFIKDSLDDLKAVTGSLEIQFENCEIKTDLSSVNVGIELLTEE